MDVVKIRNGLDVIKTSILMCGKDDKATVLYKNSTARNIIKIPTIGSGIHKHINRSYIDSYRHILIYNRPKIIALNIRNLPVSALVGNYIFDDADVTMWIFLSMLRIKSYHSFFGNLIDRDEILFEDFIEVVDEFSDFDIYGFTKNKSGKHDARFQRIQSIMASFINNLYDSKLSNKNHYYNMPTAIDAIINQSKNTMAKSGYRFALIKDRLSNSDVFMCDIGVFLSVYATLIAIGINISRNKEGYLEFYNDENNLIIELNITLTSPWFYTESCNNIRELIKTFPEECFNLMLFNQYIEYKEWKFDFEITKTFRNNFKLRVYAETADEATAAKLRGRPIDVTEFTREMAEIEDFVRTMLNFHLSQ
jgi:hypothetical protein